MNSRSGSFSERLSLARNASGNRTTRSLRCVAWFLAGCLAWTILSIDGGGRIADAAELQTEDPFAAVDGRPVTVARLNRLIRLRFGTDEPTDQMRRAAATMLVREALAMRTLRVAGGEALKKNMQTAWNRVLQQADRRGVTIEEQARATGANEAAMRDEVHWQHAWGSYLRQYRTEANLRKFYSRQPSRYGGQSFETLVDPLRLQREATEAMFNELVRRSRDAKVVWFDARYEPPTGYPLIPPASTESGEEDDAGAE